jgi:hypothetical protein
MNFLILLILSLILVGFALTALGINFFLRRSQSLKNGPLKNESAKGGKDIRCGCGRENCCPIEYAQD